MNPSLGRCSFLAFLCLLAIAGPFGGPSANGQTQDDALTVIYTGRLYGYYQIEPGQEQSQNRLPAVDNFLTAMMHPKATGGLDPLLLGMGDNFGPEFGASLQMPNKGTGCEMKLTPRVSDLTGEEEISYPRSLYKNFNRVAAAAECDNVLNFLTQAGYRAIVPGRLDFLYSTWWLNRMANLLRVRKDAIENSDRKHASEQRDRNVQNTKTDDSKTTVLLSANLRLRVSAAKSAGKGSQNKDSKDMCPLLLDPDFPFVLDPDLPNPPDRDATRISETCANENTPDALDWLARLDRLIDPSSDKATQAWHDLEVRTQDRGNGKDKNLGTIRLRNKVLENQTKIMFTMLTNAKCKDPQCEDSQCKGPQCKDPRCKDSWRCMLTNLQALAKTDHDLADANATGGENAKARDQQRQLATQIQTTLLRLCGVDRPEEQCKSKLLGRYPHVIAFGLALMQKHLDELNLPPEKTNDVSTPLLPAGVLAKGRLAILWQIHDSQENIGFTELELQGSVNKEVAGTALIIGVNSEDTMSAVSLVNKSVCYDPDAKSLKEFVVDCAAPPSDTQEAHHRATVQVSNPVPTIEAILRAAQLVYSQDHPDHPAYLYRILLAQMPKTEAQELEARLRADAHVPGADLPMLDLILSEAQPDHATPDITVQYDANPGANLWPATPVLTPRPAYRLGAEQPLVRPDSKVVIRSKSSPGCDRTRCVENTFTTKDDLAWGLDRPPAGNEKRDKDPEAGKQTTLYLLMKSVEEHNHLPGSAKVYFPSREGDDQKPKRPLTADECANRDKSPECEVAVTQFLLRRLQIKSHADVVLLQRRDIFLGPLPRGYSGYEACPTSISDEAKLSECKVKVALDRVLWKGDYYDRVMLSGKELASLMATASAQSQQENTLVPSDISQKWLVTFGIETKESDVLTRRTVQSNEFSVQQDKECADAAEETNPSAGGKVLYCVNGVPIQADHAYSVATSDHLAEDTVIYTAMSSLPPEYRQASRDFLIETIASTLQSNAGDKKVVTVTEAEARHQKRGIFQLDIGKVAVGYSFRQPQGGDNYVSNNFQGSTDSRASSPLQAELDVEGKSRMYWKASRYAMGIQSDLQYDRSVVGNLSGNPVNAVYPLNNFTIGGFLQVNIPPPPLLPKTRNKAARDLSAGRAMLVFAPYQYQTQLTGNYSFFPFSSPLQGQLPLHAPSVWGFAQKAGFRWEAAAPRDLFPFDKGTYVEFGGQWFKQQDVLSAVTLATPGQPPVTCDATSDVAIAMCFKTAKYPIDPQTQVTSEQETLTNGGLYWDVHLQKALVKLPDKGGPGISLVVDSQGNAYFRRGASNALSTQTLYDAPISVALTFPIFRNLSLAPTYSVFFYGNQVVAQHLVVNKFVVSARWYFDRDSGVSPIRQMLFKGPASADETQTARIK